jgi:hypothetical protein
MNNARGWQPAGKDVPLNLQPYYLPPPPSM